MSIKCPAHLTTCPPSYAATQTIAHAPPEAPALQDCNTGNVRFGSKANIAPSLDYVRFTPESGHQAARLACLLSAKSGLTQCSIPCHSITSLACASIVDGMSRPSVPLSGASIVNPGVFEFAGRQVPGRSLRTPNFHRDHREAERAGHCLNFTHIQQGDRIAGIGQNR